MRKQIELKTYTMKNITKIAAIIIVTIILLAACKTTHQCPTYKNSSLQYVK